MKYDSLSRYYEGSDTGGCRWRDRVIFNPEFTWTVVRPEERDRIDLVAYRLYKNPLLWWRIASLNAILDPSNLPSGTRLRVPKV